MEYVADAAGDGEVELFTCWDGDWLDPAARRIDLTADQLADPALWFEELVFATVRAPRPAAAP